MITLMRRYRRTLQVGLLLVVVAFVASLFIFGAAGTGDGLGQGDAVAVVNGERIPADRYQRRYRAYRQTYERLYRERFSPAFAERLGLPQQVLNDLVTEALVVQRAQAEGLVVSDAELNARVHAMAAFREAGRFSLARYQAVLRRAGLTPAAFEADLRRELTRLVLESAVKAGARVSAAEVEQAFVYRRTTVRVAWALVELGPILDATRVDDAAIEAHLRTHPDEFRQPERRRVQYVTVAQRDFRQPVAEAAVAAYYREHAKEFETPRQLRAAHVLVRVPETGGSAAEDRARERVAEVIRRARAGEDFARLAREVSEDPGSAKAGGDLGWISAGETVPEFERALFGLRKGELTPEPVRTPFGFHAIRLTDVREGGRKPLREVAPLIRDKLADEAAEKAARSRAEAIRPALQAATDFMAEARRLGLTPQAATIARSERLPGLEPADPLEETAFALATGGVSPVVKTPTGFAVVKLLAVLPAGVPPLAEIRDQVALAARRARAEAQALERARALARQARDGDFAAVARQAGALRGESGRFSRAAPDEKLPGDAQVAALEAPVGAVIEPVTSPRGVWVLKVLERSAPDMQAFPAERDKLERELRARKQGLAWEAWLRAVRAGARIEVSGRLTPPGG